MRLRVVSEAADGHGDLFIATTGLDRALPFA